MNDENRKTNGQRKVDLGRKERRGKGKRISGFGDQEKKNGKKKKVKSKRGPDKKKKKKKKKLDGEGIEREAQRSKGNILKTTPKRCVADPKKMGFNMKH